MLHLIGVRPMLYIWSVRWYSETFNENQKLLIDDDNDTILKTLLKIAKKKNFKAFYWPT